MRVGMSRRSSPIIQFAALTRQVDDLPHPSSSAPPPPPSPTPLPIPSCLRRRRPAMAPPRPSSAQFESKVEPLMASSLSEAKKIAPPWPHVPPGSTYPEENAPVSSLPTSAEQDPGGAQGARRMCQPRTWFIAVLPSKVQLVRPSDTSSIDIAPPDMPA